MNQKNTTFDPHLIVCNTINVGKNLETELPDFE